MYHTMQKSMKTCAKNSVRNCEHFLFTATWAFWKLWAIPEEKVLNIFTLIKCLGWGNVSRNPMMYQLVPQKSTLWWDSCDSEMSQEFDEYISLESNKNLSIIGEEDVLSQPGNIRSSTRWRMICSFGYLTVLDSFSI